MLLQISEQIKLGNCFLSLSKRQNLMIANCWVKWKTPGAINYYWLEMDATVGFQYDKRNKSYYVIAMRNLSKLSTVHNFQRIPIETWTLLSAMTLYYFYRTQGLDIQREARRKIYACKPLWQEQGYCWVSCLHMCIYMWGDIGMIRMW